MTEVSSLKTGLSRLASLWIRQQTWAWVLVVGDSLECSQLIHLMVLERVTQYCQEPVSFEWRWRTSWQQFGDSLLLHVAWFFPSWLTKAFLVQGRLILDAAGAPSQDLMLRRWATLCKLISKAKCNEPFYSRSPTLIETMHSCLCSLSFPGWGTKIHVQCSL